MMHRKIKTKNSKVKSNNHAINQSINEFFIQIEPNKLYEIYLIRPIKLL